MRFKLIIWVFAETDPSKHGISVNARIKEIRL